jgi:hypothetical protein
MIGGPNVVIFPLWHAIERLRGLLGPQMVELMLAIIAICKVDTSKEGDRHETDTAPGE